MTASAGTLLTWMSAALGGASEAIALSLLFVAGLLLLPGALVMIAAAASHRGMPAARTRTDVARRFVIGLVPFGLGVWVAHYGFHLLVGALVVVPVTQSAVIDWIGAPLLGAPRWTWAGLRPGAALPWQLGFTLLGGFGSLASLLAIADRTRTDRPFRAAAPWLALLAVLVAAAVWVMLQPMEMRGTGL
jgi:hypothetical protein